MSGFYEKLAKHFEKRSLIWIVFLSLLPLIIVVEGIIKARYGCLNGYDFGIFQQAMFELSTFKSFNPFVTIRGIKIFNDHFHPVIMIPSFLMGIFGTSQYFLLIFEALTVVIAALLIFKLKNETRTKVLLTIFLLFFSRGILAGLRYPVHASFWSIPIWVWLIHSFYFKGTRQIVLGCLALCFFRETYPPALLFLALGFGLRKEYRTATGVLAVSLLFSIFVFKIRPLLMGGVHDHGNSMLRLNDFITSPFQTFWLKFTALKFSEVIKTFLPGILLAVFCWFRGDRDTRRVLFLCLSLLTPLVGIQFLAGKFTYHYAFPFFIVPICIFYFSRISPEALPRWQIPLLILAFLLTGGRYYELASKLVFAGKMKNCSITDQRLEEIRAVKEFMKEVAADKTVAMTGSIIQAILEPGQKVYQLSSHGDFLESYDYLVLERNKSGDTRPVSLEKVEQIIQKCRYQFTRIIRENDMTLIAEGPVAQSCLKTKQPYAIPPNKL